MRGDAKKLAAIRGPLIELVSRGNLESAYSLVVSTIGSTEIRGWGYSSTFTIDLMQRIMTLQPGHLGVEVAVAALCGQSIYGMSRNFFSQARYEQDLAQYRSHEFIIGIEWKAEEWSCQKGKQRAGCYRLTDAPKFPDPGCNCESGCICWWSAIFEDTAPSSPWRSTAIPPPAPALPAALRKQREDDND